MYCSTRQIPCIYALLKTHQENFPFRPIVSFIGSPAHQISNYLSKILPPFADNLAADQKLKNSYQVKEVLSGMFISSDNELVSFAVLSHFFYQYHWTMRKTV